MLYLGVDTGTQGTKSLIVDESGIALGRGYSPHRLIETSSGKREQDPAWWVEAMCVAVPQALQGVRNSHEVKALAVSGQQHGLVILDEQKQIIRPAKLWNDTETASANAELTQRFGGAQEYLRRFGIVPLAGYTVSKLLWLAQHEPANFAKIRHILLPHEYLNYWLTGHMRAEYGDASGTGFFDPRTREWTRDVLDEIDGGTGHLFAALPPLSHADEIVGTLTPHAAQKLGLPTGCMVAAGGGDNMMGAIGTGNVQEGIVTLSLGTSATAYSFSAQPTHDPTGSVAPFCSSSGGWLPLVCTMNATNVVTATTRLVGKTVADIEEAFENTPPGADGLVFLPFLNGERTPDLPDARGSIHGVAATNFTPSHLLRAAVEGVTFGILEGLDLMLDGGSPNLIQVIGGGSRSRAWRQLIADATGATITVPVEEEAGCLGAAIQAMVAVARSEGQPSSFREVTDRVVKHNVSESCTPDPDLRASYDEARQRYRGVLQSYVSQVHTTQ